MMKTPKYIFKTIVGSQAYGTNTTTSDVDYKGVFVQNPIEILTFHYKEQIEVSKDEMYFEVRRFLQLLQSANPTMLELLFMPKECVIVQEKEFDLIVTQREKFLTKKCFQSFAGYASAQIKKAKGLDKKMNWEKQKVERKTPLHFCYVIEGVKSKPLLSEFSMEELKQAGLSHIQNGTGLYGMFLDPNHTFQFKGLINDDETSTSLRVDSIPIEWYTTYQNQPMMVWYNKNGYETHCKDYKEYQIWLETRNTQRYVDIEGHQQQIDGKNLLHCRRLLDMAKEIVTDHTIHVRRPNAQELLDIRKGKVNLENIILKAEEDLLEIESLYQKSSLPEEVDWGSVNSILEEIRLMNY